MKESDWKIFKQIKDKAIDQFCRDALSTFSEITTDEDKSAHERYLQLYDTVDKTNRKMSSLFDDHSRSKAALQLLVIRREGLADAVLVAKLSDDFKESTDPAAVNW